MHGPLSQTHIVGASIPSPPARWFDVGPLHIHYYALFIIAGIVAAVWLTYRRWTARGGSPDLVYEVALWSVIAGLIGGRLYFDITTPDQMGHEWYAAVAVWQGGLGIPGAVLFGTLTGAFVVHRRGASVRSSWMPPPRRCRWHPGSGVWGTGSTRSCSAGPHRCHGASRSIRPTARPTTPTCPPSSPRFCTRCSGTSGWRGC